MRGLTWKKNKEEEEEKKLVAKCLCSPALVQNNLIGKEWLQNVAKWKTLSLL